MIIAWTGEQFENQTAYNALHGGVVQGVVVSLLGDDLTVSEAEVRFRLWQTLYHTLELLMAAWHEAQMAADD